MSERIAYDNLVYESPILQLRSVGLQMPGGHVLQRDLVHYTGAAVVLPVLADGGVVLIRNYRFAVGEDLWELPAGMLEKGEQPEACAARELTEETGYTAGRIEKLCEFYSAPGTSDERIHAYLATDLTDGRQRLEADEEIAVEVVAEADARRMILDGTIHDGKTIAALLMHWTKRESA